MGAFVRRAVVLALAPCLVAGLAAFGDDRANAPAISDANDPRYLTAQTRKMGGALPPEQQALEIRHLDLATRVFPEQQRIESTATLTLRTSANLAELVVDFHPKFTIHRVQVDGRDVPPSNYSNPDGQLRVRLRRATTPGATIILRVVYSGTPPLAKRPPWEGGTTWTRTTDGNSPLVDTSLWGGGCDLLFPCIDHPTRKAALVDEHYTVPKGLMAPGNGRFLGSREKDGWVTWNWRARSVHTYGPVLNVGPYKVLEGDYHSRFGNTIPMRLYYLPGEEQQAEALFREFPQTLDFWESRVGPYPWADEKMGVIRVPYSGLENQTLVGHSDDFPKTRFGFDFLMNHEFSHEWFGNQMSVANYDDLWLHEGFGSYAQALLAEHLGGQIDYLAYLKDQRVSIANDQPLVTGRERTEEEVYASPSGPRGDIYPKGSWIAHSLRHLIGDEAFFESLRMLVYGRRDPRPGNFVPQFGTTNHYLGIVNEITGKDYGWFFDVYLRRAELPRLESRHESGKLKLRWVTADNLPFPMPVDVRIGDRVVTLPMTGGTGEAAAAENAPITLDPYSRILMQSDAIDQYRSWRAEQSKKQPGRSQLSGEVAPPGAIWVDDIGLTHYSQRRGKPRAGKSLRDQPIVIGGVRYAHGIGTRSISEFVIDLKGSATRFVSMVGFDDAVRGGIGSVTFEVWADDTRVAESGLMRAGDAPRLLSADLKGARTLTLLVDDGGDTSNDDEVAWAGAMIELTPGAPSRLEALSPPREAPVIIAPAVSAPRPAIHGPRVTGATPGRPFLFRIPATGEAPLRYSARDLPAGLTLDPATGIISGSLREAGEWRATLIVKGARGSARRELRIVGGDDALSRTPPMGWNSWNVWGPAVDQQKVLDAAAWLDRSGLAAHGYQYVVIDDAWMGTRGADGSIRPNEKFPDMRALADAVHARGLKLGIYSSPGPKTCEGYIGSHQHEAQDAATFASWGIDFLKYDWCSYEEVARDHSLAELQKPYFVMRDALARVDRDIVYALCQYGYGDVWKWGAQAGGQLWRSSGDLLDQWANLESVGFRQAGRERWTRPGEWNDTDMLVVGTLGWGPDLRPTRLTRNEQVLHLTLWALQAAPLFIGADLSKLDDFTLALLTNDEVIDVDQDPLGQAAGRLWRDARREIWARPLQDGTYAVGLFNRGLAPAEVTIEWSMLGLRGSQPVRDLWRREDVGRFAEKYSATVPRHGAVFVKVGRPK